MFVSAPPRSTLSMVSSLPLVRVYLYNLHEVSHNRHKELENAIYVGKIKQLSLVCLEKMCPGDMVVAIKYTGF